MKCGSAVQRYLAVHELGCCSLLAGTSFIVFMTLLPLMIDPSVLTFVLDLEPAACLTVHSAALNGTSNCTWTSCQQGCTVDIYKCWHVNVSYLLADPALAAERLDAQLLESPYPPPQQPARLYPNVVGCGYPPDVDCDQFFRDYAQTGAFERTFPCYVSMTDPSVAVIHVDRFQAACHLAIGFAPLMLCIVLSVYVSLRLRCQRRSQMTARASGLTSAATLAEEQARRIMESKRRLESRKQSWLNAFRQERINDRTTSGASPSPGTPSLKAGLSAQLAAMASASSSSASASQPANTNAAVRDKPTNQHNKSGASSISSSANIHHHPSPQTTTTKTTTTTMIHSLSTTDLVVAVKRKQPLEHHHYDLDHQHHHHSDRENQLQRRKPSETAHLEEQHHPTTITTITTTSTTSSPSRPSSMSIQLKGGRRRRRPDSPVIASISATFQRQSSYADPVASLVHQQGHHHYYSPVPDDGP